MKIKQLIEPKYVLELTDEERVWLKGYLQNPVVHPSDEPAEDSQMRKMFFNALTTA